MRGGCTAVLVQQICCTAAVLLLYLLYLLYIHQVHPARIGRALVYAVPAVLLYPLYCCTCCIAVPPELWADRSAGRHRRTASLLGTGHFS